MKYFKDVCLYNSWFLWAKASTEINTYCNVRKLLNIYFLVIVRIHVFCKKNKMAKKFQCCELEYLTSVSKMFMLLFKVENDSSDIRANVSDKAFGCLNLTQSMFDTRLKE